MNTFKIQHTVLLSSGSEYKYFINDKEYHKNHLIGRLDIGDLSDTPSIYSNDENINVYIAKVFEDKPGYVNTYIYHLKIMDILTQHNYCVTYEIIESKYIKDPKFIHVDKVREFRKNVPKHCNAYHQSKRIRMSESIKKSKDIGILEKKLNIGIDTDPD